MVATLPGFKSEFADVNGTRLHYVAGGKGEAVVLIFNDQIGYFKLQATRPQTMDYSLADFPAGLAMWIYEKFQAWSDNQGNPEDAISDDALLDNITLYWLTNTGTSSARIYWQNKGPGFDAGRIELPICRCKECRSRDIQKKVCTF